jgi:hypothetical protein
MLNPAIDKLLIINPTADEKMSLKMLAYDTVIADLVRKVFGLKEDERFTPRLMSEKDIRRFIAVTKPTIVSIQSYANEELKTLSDARKYLAQMGKDFYGEGWFVNLLKNEIQYSEETVFGVDVPDSGLASIIAKEMEDFVRYEIRPYQETKSQKQNAKQTKPETLSENKGNENE